MGLQLGQILGSKLGRHLQVGGDLGQQSHLVVLDALVLVSQLFWGEVAAVLLQELLKFLLVVSERLRVGRPELVFEHLSPGVADDGHSSLVEGGKVGLREHHVVGAAQGLQPSVHAQRFDSVENEYLELLNLVKELLLNGLGVVAALAQVLNGALVV